MCHDSELVEVMLMCQELAHMQVPADQDLHYAIIHAARTRCHRWKFVGCVQDHLTYLARNVEPTWQLDRGKLLCTPGTLL